MEVSKPWGKELGLSFSEGGNMRNQMVKEIEKLLVFIPPRSDFYPGTMKDSITIQLVNTEQ